MNELIDVFRMNEVSVATRCKIIIQLGELINFKYCSNVTEPLVYELVKALDPDNKEVERVPYNCHLKDN